MPQHRRRRALVIALALIGAGVAIALGMAAEAASEVAVATGARAGAAEVSTPLWSARRVPAWLVRPVAGRRLAAAVDPVLAPVRDQACLVVADHGTVVLDRNGTTPVSPASNQKLLVGSAALSALGADAHLSTRFAAGAAVAGDGTVAGDLWMIGAGDPVIDTDNYQATLHYGRTQHTALESVADQLVAAGVRHVTGSVKGDDHRYDEVRSVPSWPSRYLTAGEVGPLSGLSVNDSRSYPASGPAPGSVHPAPDPPAYAAATLTDLLRARGVAIDGAPASGTAPGSLTTILDVPSLSVADIVGEMLTSSDNNTAELLTKELGRHAGKAGTTEAGVAAVKAELDAAGIPLGGQVMVDGSGLDPTDRVTCRLLDAVLEHGGSSGPLAAGLPVAAKTGTLADRFVGSPLAGRVRAKTGTLRTVTSLSGWLTTSTGADVSFAYVLNTTGAPAGDGERARAERVVAALDAYPDAPAAASVGPRPPRVASR